MPFAAVISASATVGHDDGLLRATLIFAGQTLIEYQARQAAEAGAGHISIHVSAITPSLSRSVDRLIADGINVSLVRSPAELRQTIPPDTDILLIGDGIVVAQSWYREIAQREAPLLLVVNDHAMEPEFERIDARHRWAGLARLNFAQLTETLDTLDVLADWDLQSTLLRHAVQTNPARLPVGDDALFKGDVVQIATQAAADAAEGHFLPPQPVSAQGQGWVEHYLFRPVAAASAPLLLRRQLDAAHLRAGAIMLCVLGLAIASYGPTWPALLLFLAGLAADDAGAVMAKIARRREAPGWRALICPGLALLGLALLGSHWRVGQMSWEFTGIYLAASIAIVELAISRGKAQAMPAWTICSLGTALALLLLFRLAGALELGFAVVILYALATVAAIVLGKPTAEKPQAAT